jgi:hypothetical protein
MGLSARIHQPESGRPKKFFQTETPPLTLPTMKTWSPKCSATKGAKWRGMSTLAAPRANPWRIDPRHSSILGCKDRRSSGLAAAKMFGRVTQIEPSLQPPTTAAMLAALNFAFSASITWSVSAAGTAKPSPKPSGFCKRLRMIRCVCRSTGEMVLLRIQGSPRHIVSSLKQKLRF